MAGRFVQTFNDDLLSHPEDQDLAGRNYPTIMHILDHPELRERFQQYDPPANAAKKKSRQWGRIAIILGAMAIAGASGEIFLLEFWHFDWVPALALIPAIAGIASVLVGNFGVLFGRNKRQWLENRLMTERLRQFHFQTFVLHVPEIIASLQSQKAVDHFKLERAKWFAEFRAQIESKMEAALVAVLEEDGEHDIWLHQFQSLPLDIENHSELRPLFDAYRVFRIEHQLNYVRYKLRPAASVFSDAAHQQLQVLDWLAGLTIAGLLLLHVAIAIGISVIAIGNVVGLWPGAMFRTVMHVGGLNLAIIWDMVIIWLALIALAGRAFEQGLQPGREIERYQQYRSALRAIRGRFDNVSSLTDKIRVMQEMERLTFDEFRNFMITNNNARFVL